MVLITLPQQEPQVSYRMR